MTIYDWLANVFSCAIGLILVVLLASFWNVGVWGGGIAFLVFYVVIMLFYIAMKFFNMRAR